MMNKERGRAPVWPPGSRLWAFPGPKLTPFTSFLTAGPAVCFPFPEAATTTSSILDILFSRNGCGAEHSFPCCPPLPPPFLLLWKKQQALFSGLTGLLLVMLKKQITKTEKMQRIQNLSKSFQACPWSEFLIPLRPFSLISEGGRGCTLLSSWCLLWRLLTFHYKYLTSRELRHYKANYYVEEKKC